MNPFGRPALARPSAPMPFRSSCLLFCSLCVIALAVPARGQTAATTLPNTLKTAQDVTAQRATIQQFVDAAAKRLASDEPADQAKGRNQLIDGITVTGGGQASVNFLDAYAQAAANALLPLTAHEDMRVRLNAAIAAARIAEKANNLRMSDVAVRFMNDKSPAVALWGVKAARAMVPAAVAGGPANNNPLMAALIQVVQRNPLGPVVSEIYTALELGIFDVQPNQRPPAAQIKAVIPNMLGVYRQRVTAYSRGALPADPSVDNVPSDFLTFSPVWTQMTPQQQLQTVQSMSDLIGFCGQYAELMGPDERPAILPVFQRTGKALQVVGDAMNLPGVVKAAKDVQGITAGMDGTEVRNRADGVALALKQAPQFASIKPAPQISMGGEESAPEPATGGDAGPASAPKNGFDGKGGPADRPAGKAGPKPAPPPLPPVKNKGVPRSQPPAAPGQGGAGPTPPSGNTPPAGNTPAAPAPPPAGSQKGTGQ